MAYLVYSDFVNSEKSGFWNLIGKLDYYDQYYSRKWQMVDNWFCNVIGVKPGV